MPGLIYSNSFAHVKIVCVHHLAYTKCTMALLQFKQSVRLIVSLIVLVTLTACGGGSSSSGGSAGIPLSFQVQGNRAMMSGELGAGSAATIQALVRDHPQIDTIVMVDVPGSLDDQSAIFASAITSAWACPIQQAFTFLPLMRHHPAEYTTCHVLS
jgi:hypothetical protein